MTIMRYMCNDVAVVVLYSNILFISLSIVFASAAAAAAGPVLVCFTFFYSCEIYHVLILSITKFSGNLLKCTYQKIPEDAQRNRRTLLTLTTGLFKDNNNEVSSAFCINKLAH